MTNFRPSREQASHDHYPISGAWLFHFPRRSHGDFLGFGGAWRSEPHNSADQSAPSPHDYRLQCINVWLVHACGFAHTHVRHRCVVLENLMVKISLPLSPRISPKNPFPLILPSLVAFDSTKAPRAKPGACWTPTPEAFYLCARASCADLESLSNQSWVDGRDHYLNTRVL